jgi:hypothetical protein
MFNNRSPLMKRLAEIMPKKPEPKLDGLGMIPFRAEPIRMAAESFASWVHDDLPANREELRAMLWVFGEILNGHMERMLNESNRLQNDLLATQPIKLTIVEKLEAKEKAFYDACEAVDVKEMERLAPKGPTYGQVVKPRTKAEEQRIIDAVNRVRLEIE